MAEITIVAEARSEFGKGAARRIRREGKVPAVLYGHGAEPVHVTLPAHDMMLALRQANALFSIEFDGESRLAVAKDVQRNPIRPILEHVDLLVVKAGEKISVEVPIQLVGEPAASTHAMVESHTLLVLADATKLPESIEVSIEGLAAGTVLLAGDITLPAGVELAAPAEQDILTINEIQSNTEDEAAAAEAGAGVEPAAE